MKRFLILCILLWAFTAIRAQDYSYSLKKTMSPNVGNVDYSFWKFPVSGLSQVELVKGDTMDITIAVDMAKDGPAIPSMELKFANESGSTDSLFISGTVKASQFHLMTVEPATGLAYQTISSTRINMSTTNPYFYVVADSVNSGGFVIPKAGVSHLRSVLYNLRLIPGGVSDTVRVTGIIFKSWVDPKY